MAKAGARPGSESGPRLGPAVGVGLCAALAFFGGLVAWSVLAPLDSATVAPGVLAVEGRRKAVEHLEGGIVAETRVAEGDRVDAGQVLVVLDGAETRTTLARLEAQARSAAALKARLEAERDGREAVRYPQDLRAALAGGDVEDVAATQDRIFAARARSLANQTAIYRQRIAQLHEEAAGLAGDAAAQTRRIALLSEEIEGLRGLVAEGYAGKPRLLALEREKAEVEGARAQNRARKARVGQRVGEAELTIGELANARLNEVVAALREVESEEAALRTELAAARAVHRRTRISAPVAGTVVGLKALTRGGVVRAGERLMELVPADGRLVVEARIAPTDRDSIRSGLAAQVRLTALPHLRTPTLEGTVAQVSADRLTDPRTGIGFYEARVALDLEQAAAHGEALQPGMPAEVLIVTGRRAALDYLLEPLAVSLWRSMREE